MQARVLESALLVSMVGILTSLSQTVAEVPAGAKRDRVSEQKSAGGQSRVEPSQQTLREDRSIGGSRATQNRNEGSDRRSAKGNPPPVRLSIAPDGRLVITSEDPKALDLLEELIGQLNPRRPDYKIFHMKYADAFWVKDNLEEFFKEEDEDENSSRRRYYYYEPPQKEEKRSRLSQRRKLKFIYDLDTNSILVQGADPNQLRTIEELIAIYDRPEPVDSKSARISRVFHIEYSKAQSVADTVKDVFRDLLSTNDKALADNPEKKNRGNPGGRTYIYGSNNNDSSERTRISFKGALSIGVDSLSNTLVVSTAGENLMTLVSQTIETLDKAAMPVSEVSVVKVGAGVNAARVSEVLSKLLAAPKQPGQGEQQKQQQPQQGGQPGQQGGRRGMVRTAG